MGTTLTANINRVAVGVDLSRAGSIFRKFGVGFTHYVNTGTTGVIRISGGVSQEILAVGDLCTWSFVNTTNVSAAFFGQEKSCYLSLQRVSAANDKVTVRFLARA
jgi:hypothetical protein